MVSVPRIGNNSKLANYSWESPKEHSICNPAGDLTINRISKAPSHPRRRLRRSQVQWRQPGTRRRRSWPPPRWRSSPSSPRRGTTMPARRRSRPSASACRTWSGRRPRRRPTAARASATSGTWAAAAWRRALCACVLSEVQAAGEMEPRRAAGLAAACKVPVGFVPTKPDFNCSAPEPGSDPGSRPTKSSARMRCLAQAAFLGLDPNKAYVQTEIVSRQ
ncbi:hypothetical protein PAHAL_4G319900 [Panicum hallii]|uniref:Uncharacterized protein n=1 Tax=Panicum hallii TaxID=206008 RepID=A0A2T8JEQ2_9POAL|nr:hypothetical protein PAHAL_4G319900 [Panicum hallii]